MSEELARQDQGAERAATQIEGPRGRFLYARRTLLRVKPLQVLAFLTAAHIPVGAVQRRVVTT